MEKQVLFVHCAGAQGLQQGSSGLVAFLQNQLSHDYTLISRTMPDPEAPQYEKWKTKLEKEMASLNGEIILVGHSVGGSVLLKYLSEEIISRSIFSVHLIAAPYWGKDTEWLNEEFTLEEGFASKLQGIKKLYLYHSLDDQIVPFFHHECYAKELKQAHTRRLHGDDHFFKTGLDTLVCDISERGPQR
jgi:predicted alpha/beta hydrolase family esterase